MSNATQILQSGAPSLARPAARPLWLSGLYAAATWAAAAIVTVALPDVVPWGSSGLFAVIVGVGATVLALLSVAGPRAGRGRAFLDHYGPWFIAVGVWLALWEVTTAKTGWLPKPFFSPPTGLLHVYVTEWQRLLICIAYSLRLWSLGFGLGAVVGYVFGIALGWSKRFAYWGMPILKLIGPAPATAWIPCTFYFFPTTFDASVFIVGLASGIPVMILTASGVAAFDHVYYDVGRNLGAKSWYLISRIAIPLGGGPLSHPRQRHLHARKDAVPGIASAPADRLLDRRLLGRLRLAFHQSVAGFAASGFPMTAQPSAAIGKRQSWRSK